MAAALVLGAAAPDAAAAADNTEITFSSSAPGTSTAIHPRINYRSMDSGGQQRALRKHVFTFPAGTVYDSLAAGSCRASAAELESRGLGACPADSRIGGGTLQATATKPPASALGSFPTDLTLFNSSHPPDAPAAEHAIIVAVSVAGDVRTAFAAPVEGNVATEHPPIVCATPGEQPPCPNGEITVSSVDYTIDEHSRTVGGRVHRLLTTPRSCPTGAWAFDSLREYRDGVSVRVGAETPCARTAAATVRRVELSVAPRTARRCRAQRFAFTATADGAPLSGATVRFANRSAVTNSAGRAAIAARLCRAGERRATAKAGGFRKGVATVRVAG